MKRSLKVTVDTKLNAILYLGNKRLLKVTVNTKLNAILYLGHETVAYSNSEYKVKNELYCV